MARKIVGGLASDTQAIIASQQLIAAETRDIERFDTNADLMALHPSPKNPRRVSLDMADVTKERISELALQPKEPIERWMARQDAFLKQLLDRDKVEPHGVWAELFSLSLSIYTRGLLQPIVAQPNGEIVAGERRWTASLLAGKRYERVIFRFVPDDQVHVLRLVENLQRSNLNVAEIASGVRQVISVSGAVSGPLSPSNPDISVAAMMTLFGCGRTQATYYRAISCLPDGDPVLQAILDGAYTSLRTAYEVASHRSREILGAYVVAPAETEKQEQGPPAVVAVKTPVPQVKMPLPTTEGGRRLLTALASIDGLNEKAIERINATLSTWAAAPDKTRKQLMAKTLAEVVEALAVVEEMDEA